VSQKLLPVLALLVGTCLPALSDETTSPAPAAVASTASQAAINLTSENEEDKAQNLLLGAYREGKKTNSLAPDIPYFLALFEEHQSHPDRAARYLLEARAIYTKQNSLSDRSKMLFTKRLGDCYYAANKIKQALAEYLKALDLSETLANTALSTSEILEAIVACEMSLKHYDQAENYSKTLVQLCRRRLEKGGVSELLSYSWALLQQADLYRASKEDAKLEVVTAEIRPLFLSLVEARMMADRHGLLPEYRAMVIDIRKQYVESINPQSPVELAWAAADFRIRTLPLVAWKNGLAATAPRAVILCIHGMGLETMAFSWLAAEMNKRGYIVYALDVRGFGSWTQTRGEEHLNYRQSLADIKKVSQVIKERNPDLPLYILGESMGGAIAIRAGARLGDILNGVIASVPSAERFQAKRMSLQTAVHFIVDPNKAFDIGSEVADRATAKESTRTMWKSDPKAKLGMTPIELIKFAAFMRSTKPQAARITKLPVLMVQGLQDQLVKPQGTFGLFEAVKSPDKTFLTIGNAEHLIFENSTPDPILIDSLDSWLKHHAKVTDAKITGLRTTDCSDAFLAY